MVVPVAELASLMVIVLAFPLLPMVIVVVAAPLFAFIPVIVPVIGMVIAEAIEVARFMASVLPCAVTVGVPVVPKGKARAVILLLLEKPVVAGL